MPRYSRRSSRIPCCPIPSGTLGCSSASIPSNTAVSTCMGLGAHDEYRSAVRHIAAMIHGEPSADAATTELIALADAQDRLLAQV